MKYLPEDVLVVVCSLGFGFWVLGALWALGGQPGTVQVLLLCTCVVHFCAPKKCTHTYGMNV